MPDDDEGHARAAARPLTAAPRWSGPVVEDLRAVTVRACRPRRRAGRARRGQQRRDDQRHQHRAQQRRTAGRCGCGAPSWRTTRSRVASLPNEPPTSAVNSADSTTKRPRVTSPSGFERDHAGARHRPLGDGQATISPVDEERRRCGEPPATGCLERRSGRRRHCPQRTESLPAIHGPGTCYTDETNGIRSRNCRRLASASAGATTPAPVPQQSWRAAGKAPPRRTHMFKNADELLKYIKDEGVEMVDVRFCDLPGVMQHFTVPVSSFDQSVFDDGLAFDGSSIRGFQAIHESDMSLLPGRDHRLHRPVPRLQDAGRQLLHPRPDHGRGLQPRPAQHRQEGDGLPRLHRHRRHRVLRPRGRVLRLRQRALRDLAERGLLPHRLRGGRLELRHRRHRGQPQPRLQGQVQGRLLPRRAVRPLRRAARRDGHRAGEVRPARSSAPTTRSAPPARPRSTTSSTSCSRPPTT